MQPATQALDAAVQQHHPTASEQCLRGLAANLYATDPADFKAMSQVHYPGLASHPDHLIARQQMRGFGGVVSFEVDGGLWETAAFIDAVKLPYIAPSLGSTESLIEQPTIISYWDQVRLHMPLPALCCSTVWQSWRRARSSSSQYISRHCSPQYVSQAVHRLRGWIAEVAVHLCRVQRSALSTTSRTTWCGSAAESRTQRTFGTTSSRRLPRLSAARGACHWPMQQPMAELCQCQPCDQSFWLWTVCKAYHLDTVHCPAIKF